MEYEDVTKNNYSILTDHNLVDCIFNIIETAKRYCFIVTPFLNIQYWDQLARRLKEFSDSKKRMLFILAQVNENNQKDDDKLKKDRENIEKIKQKLNNEYNFDLYFVKNLHAKIYLNENEVLITSMNLQESSANNNHEIGCLIKDPAIALEIVNNVIFKQILRGEKEPHVKGMWSDWLRNGQFLDDNIGYCIKCKSPISFNQNTPLCGKCYDNNADGINKFCHKCGGHCQTISINTPLCHICYGKIKNGA
jgi:hypothetical protein